MYESERTYHVHLAAGNVDGLCGIDDTSGEPVVCPADGSVG
jgi:predicted metalloprotease